MARRRGEDYDGMGNKGCQPNVKVLQSKRRSNGWGVGYRRRKPEQTGDPAVTSCLLTVRWMCFFSNTGINLPNIQVNPPVFCLLCKNVMLQLEQQEGGRHSKGGKQTNIWLFHQSTCCFLLKRRDGTAHTS